MSEDDIAVRTCQYPDCTRPARPSGGKGRPPQYCDLPEHSSINALRERQRRHRAAARDAAERRHVPDPRNPHQAGHDDAGHAGAGDPDPDGKDSGREDAGGEGSAAGQAGQIAGRIAEELAAASARARRLAGHLEGAQREITELTARAETAEAELVRQREYYEARLLLLGELPRPHPPS